MLQRFLFLYLSIIIANPAMTQIISYELIKSWSKEEVSNLYQEYGIPESSGQINYAVNGYKILYFTPEYNGEIVMCSGAIFLPSGINCPPPLLSWQHGTEANDEGAPSNVGNNANDLIGVTCAANGYIVTMSDFIGLGEGDGFHNYVHAETEASATIDLIIYGKEFAQNMLGIPDNGQLFLFGYSQGGHATMAAVQEIESNYSDQLTITASAPMAGPYSMSEAQREMIDSGAEYPSPGYLPYLLFAYNKIYNLYEDVDEVLVPPYNNFLFSMYDGTHDMWEMNELLPPSPIDILKDEYYEEYLNNEDHPLKLALRDNDVYEFTPQSTMRLIHCSGDDNVTYENSEIAYNYFLETGAQNIELIDGGNLTHLQCASLAILSGKMWFDTIAELCQPLALPESSNLHSTKELIYTIDLLGRKTHLNQNNKYIINKYSDGSHQKIIKLP